MSSINENIANCCLLMEGKKSRRKQYIPRRIIRDNECTYSVQNVDNNCDNFTYDPEESRQNIFNVPGEETFLNDRLYCQPIQSFDEHDCQQKQTYNARVDPAKYRIIGMGNDGIRYACSLCGNCYKWRKSLNKHWKEKHRFESPPPLDADIPINVKFQQAFKENSDISIGNNTINVKRESPITAQSNNSEERCFTNNDKNDDPDINCGDVLDLSVKTEGVNNWPTGCELEIDYSSLIIQCCNSFITNCEQKKLSNSQEHENNKRNLKMISLKRSRKNYICDVCKSENVTLEEANNHFAAYHADTVLKDLRRRKECKQDEQSRQVDMGTLSDPDNALKCVHCCFVGRWPTELLKHSACHSDERPFKCVVCSLTYKWEWDLSKHFKRVHTRFPNPYNKQSTPSVRKSKKRKC